MGLFGRLFVPLFVVLAAVGGWLVVESEQGTIHAIEEPEGAPGTLAPEAGPAWARPEGAAPPATAQTAAKHPAPVVVLTGPHPAALSRVTAWMKTFDRKTMVAAPVSAVAKGGS